MRRSARNWPLSDDAAAGAGGRLLQPDALSDHVDRLYRAACAMCGSHEDAEDLVQETYTRVLAKRRLLRSEDDLAYLLRVLRNTHVSRLRAAGRRPVTDRERDGADEIDPRSTARPEAALETRELFAAIAALPAHQRDALVAVDVAGLSYREAGRALRVKEATVTTRLHRARQAVAARVLEPQPATPAPARAAASRGRLGRSVAHKEHRT